MSVFKTISSVVSIFVMLIFSSTAYAHGGATGIVKERMDAMSSMAESMKALTPMMRGKTEYDPQEVRKQMLVISQNAGPYLLAMFPEGSISDVSEARPRIWNHWNEFGSFANELSVLSTGLINAADNVDADSLAGVAPDMNSMMDTGMGGGMMGENSKEVLTVESVSEMPVTMIFRKLNQNCTACHSRFRSEKQK